MTNPGLVPSRRAFQTMVARMKWEWYVMKTVLAAGVCFLSDVVANIVRSCGGSECETGTITAGAWKFLSESGG